MDAVLCAPNVPFGKQRQTNYVHYVSLLMSWTKAEEESLCCMKFVSYFMCKLDLSYEHISLN